MNSFLITSHGRTGTKFLSQVMNKSRQWQVKHQPDINDDGDRIIPKKKFYDAVIPSYQQRRFNQDYYGEVNGLLKYNFFKLNVANKGIICRDYKDVILSFSNGRDGRELILGLIQKVRVVNLCHNMFYDFLEKHPKVVLIEFDNMVSSVSYLKSVLNHFGIFDVVINKKVLHKKINSNTKWNNKTYEDFPDAVKKLIKVLTWKDYSQLNNYL